MAAAPGGLLKKSAPMSLPRDERSRRFVAAFAERDGFRELAAGLGDIGALAFQVLVNGAAQAGIGDVMRGMRGARLVAARELVLALCTGLDDPEPMLDGVVDRLVVADLEMQERMMLDRAPVAPEQRVRADEVDRAGDPAVIAAGHHQEHVAGHATADQRIERAVEIWPAPFA